MQLMLLYVNPARKSVVLNPGNGCDPRLFVVADRA